MASLPCAVLVLSICGCVHGAREGDQNDKQKGKRLVLTATHHDEDRLATIAAACSEQWAKHSRRLMTDQQTLFDGMKKVREAHLLLAAVDGTHWSKLFAGTQKNDQASVLKVDRAVNIGGTLLGRLDGLGENYDERLRLLASEEQEKKFMKKCKDEQSSWWPSHLEGGGERNENAPEVGVEPEKDKVSEATPEHLVNEDGKNDTEPDDVASMELEEEHPYEKLEDDAAHSVHEHLKGRNQGDLTSASKNSLGKGVVRASEVSKDRATDASKDASRQRPFHPLDRSRERQPDWRTDLA